jgi:hypothetical protein
MDLCSEKHDEVCYEGVRCPACDKIDDLEEQVEDLTKELAKAEAEIIRLENE